MPEVAKISVSRETLQRLEQFQAELLRWSRSINLVAPSTKEEAWNRHIEDCAQLLSLADPKMSRWTDMGSGGGLPAIVIAILAKELNPRLHMTMIESDKRKSAFLRLCVGRFGLNAKAINERIETARSAEAEIVTARALAPLNVLLGYAEHHLLPGGLAILPKGRQYMTEIDQATIEWEFDVDIRPSIVDADSRILLVRNIQRRNSDA
ncbi:16S rRNA (guanine(527)-N(7))-methyltransferase RsmG [Pararhodobacter sp.]